MLKKRHSRKQKMYKMVGCSKTKKHLGGSSDAQLAYTGQHVPTIPNPFLAYTGKGGRGINVNASDPSMPNTGPIPSPTEGTIFNIANTIRGGCGGTCGLMKGGCGGTCGLMKGGGGGCSICKFLQKGGHRKGCKCSKCKGKKMKGGNPYPNGLVGSPLVPSNVGTWPGVNGLPGNNNHYELNTLTNDPTRMMKMSGGRKTKRRGQKGGTMSNFIGQDLINLGRQFQFGIGSAYNALAGYSAPVNPLPWKDQFPTRASINPATI